MKVVYEGRHAAVDVPVLGVEDAKRGEPIEVDEKTGRALLALGPDWKKAADKPAPTKDGK